MPAEQIPAVVLEDLSRSHGQRKIVDQCSCTLYAGEIVGLVGPNGAGKTTLIKLLLGYIRPSSGTIRIHDIELSQMKKHPEIRVGANLEDPVTYDYMTGMDHLRMTANMYKDLGPEDISGVIDLVGLKSIINKRVHKYTEGQRYMLTLARALLPYPQLLILDEPTSCLDPMGIKDLRTILKKVAGKGICILISSHILAEMDQLCSRIIIMKEGQFISDMQSQELLDPDRVRVEFRVGQPDKAYEIVEALFDDITIRLENETLVMIGENLRVSQINRTLIFNDVDVFEINVTREPLEEYFMEIMEGKQDSTEPQLSGGNYVPLNSK